MSTSTALQITDEQKRLYRENGYFVLERAIPDEHLQILRNECQMFLDAIHAEMDAAGKDVMGINHRNKRYFIGNRYKQSTCLHEFLFSDLTAQICLATIGPDAFLFNEQYVLKCAEVGMKFGWHQDSGYVGHPHKPYVSIWCALDDVNVENGTVYMLPYARAGTRELVKHRQEDMTNDLIGYGGDDPGEPVIVPAGSVAAFSSTCFHRSGANATNRMRRVYLAQYSPEIIMSKDGTKPWGLSDPFLSDGRRVR